MKLALEILGVVSLLELCLWLPGLRRLRRVLASVMIVLLAITNGALIILEPALWTVLMLIISAYRVINLLRIVEARMHADHLRRATFRSSFWLILAQLGIVGVWELGRPFPTHVVGWLEVLGFLQILVLVILLRSLLRHIHRSAPVIPSEHYADSKLPTVTVAIPARNETEALQECLASIVASNYPKLEILVLDDCSQNPHTAEIIRGFAHDGVRFIKGAEPDETWLAKNQAYQRLFEESSGELLLFCGVDVRLAPSSIRALVETLLEKRKNMISIIPENVPPHGLQSLLVQPMRYGWELALPRKLFRRPPVLGTCWIARRGLLEKAGGFGAVRHMIVPASYFARVSARETDGYSFLRSSAELTVTSTKNTREQRATAIRTRYPQLHRRPEQVALISALELCSLVGPYALLLYAILRQEWVLAGLSGGAVLLAEWFYIKLTAFTYRIFITQSVWLLPLAALYYIGLLQASMWQYEFSEVVWKGRNICLPVMHVDPHLPKLQ
jgi:hypothetical protein